MVEATTQDLPLEERVLKTICCVCFKHIKGDENDEEISHGLCESCFAVEVSKLDEPDGLAEPADKTDDPVG